MEVPKNPPPPPPKRLSRPKITLQIPEPMAYRGPPTANKYRSPTIYYVQPNTPGSRIYPEKNPEWYMNSMNYASDFIMNTAKSGLSFGEKSAFWFVSKLKKLSKRWFTHFFLFLCLLLYSVMGAAIFQAFEAPYEAVYDKKLEDLRRDLSKNIRDVAVKYHRLFQDETFDHVKLLDEYLAPYEDFVIEYHQHLPTINNVTSRTWTFYNAMFYAGTIYTSIGKFKNY